VRQSAAPFLALSCAAIFTNGAEGQVYGDPQGDERPDVVVDGQKEVELPKQVAPLVNTPRSIVVVPKEVIEETGSASLVDALRTVPGITFGAAEGGNPIGDRPFIRGFDSQGSTYLDGVRDFAAQSREVFATESIQVVRGSDSTLGGRGSAGGTINVVSKMPANRDFIVATGSLGTADYKRATIDINRRLTDTIAFRIEGLYHDQDVAGRDYVYQRRWGVAPSLIVGLGTPTRVTGQFYYLEGHELPDSGIPYLYTIGNAPLGTNRDEPAIGRITTIGGTTGTVDRSTFYGLSDRDFRDSKVAQGTLRAEHDLGRLTLRNTLRFTHNVQNYIYTQPDDQQGNVFGTAATNPNPNPTGSILTGGYVWRRANTRYGYADALTNQTDLYGTFETGRIKHSISAGVELDWEKARRGTYVTRGYLNSSNTEILSTGSTISPRCTTASIARFYCASLFSPNANDAWVNYASDTSTTPADIVRTLPIEETVNKGRTQSLYGFDSITIADPLIVNVGLRYDHFKSILEPGATYTATNKDRLTRSDSLFNYQIGAVFKPTANTSVYASYATSATPPNSLLGEGQEGNALPTSATSTNLSLLDTLKPEKSRSYEIGAKADLFAHTLNLTLALFQTDTKNLRTTGEDNTVVFAGNRRIRGIEFGVNGQILPGWTAFGGFTHIDPVITDGGYTALAVAAVTQTVNGVTTTIRPATTVQVVSVNTGRQATQTAKDSLTAWTNLTLFKRLQIGGGAFYTSRVYGGYTDNRAATQNAAGVITVTPATKTILRSIPGYWRFDARAGFEFSRRVNLSVNVQNLTNKTYFSQAYTAHYATIAPGRSAFATLSIRY